MKANSHKTVIVGGGIWGLSTALHLSRSPHHEVLVVERNDRLAAETTLQSAGQVGQLRTDPILANAVGYSLELLSTFKDQTGHDPGFVRSGSLHLALTPERAAAFEELASTAVNLGIPVEFVDRAMAAKLAPDFAIERTTATLYVPNDGYLSARQTALAFAAAAQDRNVKIDLGVAVERIDIQSDGRKRLVINREEIVADQVVLACGPWTGILARQLGVQLPMHPIRLQQARTIDVGVPANHPVIRVPDESCYVRPEDGGYLFGFFDPQPLAIALNQQTSTLRTVDVQPDPSLVKESATRLADVFPKLSSLEIAQYRQGMMTCTPDGRFVLGPLAGLPGIYVATGCGGTGIAAAAAIGRWLSNWIMDGSPGEDLTQYAPDRYADQVHDDDWLRERCRATSASYYSLVTHDT